MIERVIVTFENDDGQRENMLFDGITINQLKILMNKNDSEVIRIISKDGEMTFTRTGRGSWEVK